MAENEQRDADGNIVSWLDYIDEDGNEVWVSVTAKW